MELYGIHLKGTNMFFLVIYITSKQKGGLYQQKFGVEQKIMPGCGCLIAIQMGKLLINHWMELGFQLLRHWKIL